MRGEGVSFRSASTPYRSRRAGTGVVPSGFDCFVDALEAKQLIDSAALMCARFHARRLASDLDLISSSGSFLVRAAISGPDQILSFANGCSAATDRKGWCTVHCSQAVVTLVAAVRRCRTTTGYAFLCCSPQHVGHSPSAGVRSVPRFASQLGTALIAAAAHGPRLHAGGWCLAIRRMTTGRPISADCCASPTSATVSRSTCGVGA